MSRLIVVDAPLPKRLATELKNRGRSAVALSELQLHRSLDPRVLERLRERLADQPFVLFTADDQMPLEHREACEGITIAIVDPWYPASLTLDGWRRDVVHRWAHTVAEQESGTWFRYGLRKTRWKAPRRKRRPPALPPFP